MKNLFILIILNLALIAKSQEVKEVQMIGDRPTQTASSYIMPIGYFQIEDGFIYENADDRIQNISFSSMLLRYGLLKNFELRFATDYSKTKISGFNDIEGFAPISLGGKIHVSEEKGWIPQIAFLGHLGILKTGSKELMQNHLSSQMILAFNHNITDLWSLGYSLGATFPSDENYTIGTYTFVSGFSFGDKAAAFIEVYGDFSSEMTADNKVNGGLTYLINNNFQLDIAGGFGLSEVSAKNYITIGIVYLFKI